MQNNKIGMLTVSQIINGEQSLKPVSTWQSYLHLVLMKRVSF